MSCWTITDSVTNHLITTPLFRVSLKALGFVSVVKRKQFVREHSKAKNYESSLLVGRLVTVVTEIIILLTFHDFIRSMSRIPLQTIWNLCIGMKLGKAGLLQWPNKVNFKLCRGIFFRKKSKYMNFKKFRSCLCFVRAIAIK